MKKDKYPHKPKKKLDSYSYHEAMDRTYLISDMIDRMMLSHSVINSHKKIKKSVRKAQKIFLELYNVIGYLEEERIRLSQKEEESSKNN